MLPQPFNPYTKQFDPSLIMPLSDLADAIRSCRASLQHRFSKEAFFYIAELLVILSAPSISASTGFLQKYDPVL